jgi:hypothetical protein
MKDNITLEQRKEMNLEVFSIIGNKCRFVKLRVQDGSYSSFLVSLPGFTPYPLYKDSEEDCPGDGDYYL